MIGSIAKKVMLLGKATTVMVGLAVVLALTVGLASTALAGTGVGARFGLGKTNTVNAITKLVGSVTGASLVIDNNSTDAAATALDLRVEAGKAPMKVNSSQKVANLNADKLDGKSDADFYAAGSKVADSSHADLADSAASAQNASTVDGKSANEIGTNGWQKVESVSAKTSESSKIQTVNCPAGKVVVGTGYGIGFGSHGGWPNEEADVVVTNVNFDTTSANVQAYEEEPTSNTWQVHARAICATAP